MLSAFRKFAGTWPARIFFLVLVASFASWGVADVVRNIGAGSSAVATVQGHDITQAQFIADFRAGMRRYQEQVPDPAQLPPGLRLQVARQSLDKLVTQQALAGQIAAMGLAVPDSQVRNAVFALNQFQGPDGKFSRPLMLAALQNNNMTEAFFLDEVRKDIAQAQILQTVGAASTPPALLTNLVFRFLNETRRADTLTFPFAGQPVPPAPAESVLRRFYENNLARYSAPEYRHVKMAILSPDSIGRGLTVADADLRTWFDAHKSDYLAPEKRSLQVITAGTAGVAEQLAAQWNRGATWDAMQAAAKAAGASATALDDATVRELPSPELARAAFAAAATAVVGPITQPLGSYVLRVTAITPAKNPSFESLKSEIRPKVAAEHAMDLVDARAQKLQDLFAGGAKIDEVPADLGATGAEGTMDAQGNTQEGTPAPIPAGTAREQIVQAVFKTGPNDAIAATEGPDHIWYALAVDSITKPAQRPFEQVRAQVLTDWQRDQVHHKQESDAARILALTKSGKSLTDAAWGSGLQVTRTPPLARGKPSPNVPAELSATLFTLKQGEATMVETNAGFVVAAVAEIIPPAATDSMGMKQAHDGLMHAMHDDYLQLYAAAVRNEAKPVIRGQIVQNLIAQQPGE